MSENYQNYQRNTLTMELMLTLSCDMRCHYCFGSSGLMDFVNNPGDMRDRVWKAVIKEIDNIKKKKYFENYQTLNIHLFGGEPALSVDKISELLDRYADNDDIVVKMVTNGMHLDKLAPILDKYSSRVTRYGEPKFYIQISYDGNPVHDLKRRDCSGKPTSDKVKESIRYMQDHNHTYTLKSTITYDMFKHMYEAYEDFLDVSRGQVAYFPTIDYSERCDAIILSKEQEEEYRKDLETSLLKIAKREIMKKRQYGRNCRTGFSWFSTNRAICGVGSGYFTIGIDGNIFPCHNEAYGGDRNKVTSIFDKEHEQKIVEMAEKFNKLKGESEDCKACPVDYCLRCQMAAYSASKKEKEEDRYIDYGHNKFRCSLYQLAGKIKKAVDRLS